MAFPHTLSSVSAGTESSCSQCPGTDETVNEQQVNNRGMNKIINAGRIHCFLRVQAVSDRDEGLNFICDELAFLFAPSPYAVYLCNSRRGVLLSV